MSIGPLRVFEDAEELALAGGSTPRHSYELLSQRALDWKRVHVWLGDERCVPPDDRDSNYALARALLVLAALSEKAAAVQRAVRDEQGDPVRCPARLARRATWLLDRAAAEAPKLRRIA